MVDARGLSCPIPVVMVQQAVKQSAPAALEVLVDDRVAVENITRFARNQGYHVSAAEKNGEYILTLDREPR